MFPWVTLTGVRFRTRFGSTQHHLSPETFAVEFIYSFSGTLNVVLFLFTCLDLFFSCNLSSNKVLAMALSNETLPRVLLHICVGETSVTAKPQVTKITCLLQKPPCCLPVDLSHPTWLQADHELKYHLPDVLDFTSHCHPILVGVVPDHGCQACIGGW